MPEMTFEVRWPDGRVEQCYSPSLVMHDHLAVGGDYTVTDFVDRSTAALAEASDRVRAKYGFACTSALATVEQIRSSAARFDGIEHVAILRMEPPLDVEPHIRSRSQSS